MSPPPSKRGSQKHLFTSKLSCSFACRPVHGWWVPPEFCSEPDFYLASPRPVALGQCWEEPLSSQLFPVWTLCLDSATRSTLSFGEMGEGGGGQDWIDTFTASQMLAAIGLSGQTVDGEGEGCL